MKKILVVEDDEVERELMRMTLERAGYEVSAAEDGARGFELALEGRPDLIVTDVQMPGADGLSLVRQVRETAEISETPILVTTGFGTGSATMTLVSGADAYEPKPLEAGSLLDSVRRLLASGRGFH
jgi:DNA-binding response OmpR family regulator